mmetsp:Transcript_25175/g.35468  ORF Transcript_25175/g.35468 Transcript_25175/m.35468 type:complete len:274 (+) Transcript_25175:351-1172(+)
MQGLLGELKAVKKVAENPARKDLKINNELIETSSFIIYQSVPSGENDVLRYVATIKDKNDDSLKELTIKEWVELMAGTHELTENNEEAEKLALDLTKLIQSCPFRGLRFETKGTTLDMFGTTIFEFVLVNDEGLANFASFADRYTFAEQFKFNDHPHACAFVNLGGDAMLVSPKLLHDQDKNRYGHLTAFLRNAPIAQIASLWKLVAETYLKQLSLTQQQQMIWFSTAGGGVAWLHFRFDKRPKYYRYGPFRNSQQHQGEREEVYTKTEKVKN